QEQLTPNLQNVVLAVVPAAHAAELGGKVAAAVRTEWKRIADAVWKACDAAGLFPESEVGFSKTERRARFDAQVTRLLSLSWQATPWPTTLDETLALAGKFKPEMPVTKAREQVNAVVSFAEKQM